MSKEAAIQKEESTALHEEGNGYVDPVITPNWIKKNCGDIYVNDKFKPLIVFYVVNTPCKDSSSRSIWSESCDFGQGDNSNNDKKISLDQVNIVQSPFVALESLGDMKTACVKLFLEDDFYKNRDFERIVVFRNKVNDIRLGSVESIFYHIRNSFAHGRFAIYEDNEDKENAIFVMEDVYQGKVSARMILKKSTLIRWMEILQSGKHPEDINIKLTKNSKLKAASKRKDTKGADK